MKWEKPAGSTQMTSCGRYCIVQANSRHWVAYAFTALNKGEELAVKPTDAEARTVCDTHEAQLARRAG